MLGELPGTLYVERVLPAVAADTATGLIAVITNPFSDRKCKITGFDLVPIADITGDATNTQNFNLIAADGTTEIGNLDFGAGASAAKGVAEAGTLTGTAAQLLLDVGESVFVQRQDVGISPALAAGHVIRLHVRGAGV